MAVVTTTAADITGREVSDETMDQMVTAAIAAHTPSTHGEYPSSPR